MSQIQKEKLLNEVDLWEKEELIELAYGLGFDWGDKQSFHRLLLDLKNENDAIKKEVLELREVNNENYTFKNANYNLKSENKKLKGILNVFKIEYESY